MTNSVREKIIDLTRSMCRVPSVTRDTNLSLQVLQMALEYLGDNVEYKFFESGGIHSIIIGNTINMRPKLALNGHVDVVDADSPDQFHPIIKDGRIYARGAADMKGHVAVMLLAFKQFLEENPDNNDVVLFLTGDEETGGFSGAQHVIKNEGFRPDVVFIPDGLGSYQIVTSQKAPHHFHVVSESIDTHAACTFHLVSYGPGAHVADSFKASNPVNNLVNVYMQLKLMCAKDPGLTVEMSFVDTINRAGNKIPSEVYSDICMRWLPKKHSLDEIRGMLEKVCSEGRCDIVSEDECEISLDAAALDRCINNMLLVYESMREKYAKGTVDNPWASTFELDVLYDEPDKDDKGEVLTSSSVHAEFGWRWPLEQHRFEDGMADMEEICAENSCKIDIKRSHGDGDGCYTDTNSPYVNKWKTAMESELGRTVEFTNSHGSSDGRHFYKFGSEVILTSAEIDNYHGANESVDIDSLVTLHNALCAFLSTFA